MACSTSNSQQPGGEHTGIGRSTDLFCSKLLSNANVPTLTSISTHRLALDEWFLVFLILISSFKLLFVYLMSENAHTRIAESSSYEGSSIDNIAHIAHTQTQGRDKNQTLQKDTPNN